MVDICIGLIGLGTVGTGVVKILQKSSGLIERRTGLKLVIKTICDKDIIRKRDVDLSGYKLTTDVEDILSDDEIVVVVELIGGYEPARTFVLEAIEAGKHVITANKALMSKHVEEILHASEENNVKVLLEASVGGCIPILMVLRESLVTENITSIKGIVNGTTNYILTKMTEDNMNYEDALEKAKELGFAEPDPSFDVNGNDSAQKLAIMASIVTGKYFTENDVELEGISKITTKDIINADKQGKVIKLLATFESGSKDKLSVKPTLLDKKHPLARVNNEFNAIFVEGDNIGEMMLYGKGAGQLPTASTVVADIVKIGLDEKV